MRKKKYTYQEVKEIVQSMGYELISKEYTNTDDHLILKDKNGYYYDATSFTKLRSGRTPWLAHKNNSYSIYNIKLWCKLNNKPFELVSTEYKTATIKLEWRCLKEECGEIFEMNWSNIQNGQSCSCCAGRQVGLSNCLATKYPSISEEWNYTRNGDLTPYDVTSMSHKDVWWKCKKCGHEWHSIISNRAAGNGCPECAIRNFSGESHPNWKGGISDIHEFLRDKIKQWKKDSMKNCNYKCIITGKNFNVIHHLYGFDLILQEVFKETGIDKKEHINEYTKEELKSLTNKCIEIHNRYPLGVCLCDDMHKLFHNKYGRGRNIPEQFYEFIKKYKTNKLESAS